MAKLDWEPICQSEEEVAPRHISPYLVRSHRPGSPDLLRGLEERSEVAAPDILISLPVTVFGRK